MRLLSGVVLFLLIVTPWYILAETQNPGYLRYDFWNSNFGCFATKSFDLFSLVLLHLDIVPLGSLP